MVECVSVCGTTSEDCDDVIFGCGALSSRPANCPRLETAAKISKPLISAFLLANTENVVVIGCGCPCAVWNLAVLKSDNGTSVEIGLVSKVKDWYRCCHAHVGCKDGQVFPLPS